MNDLGGDSAVMAGTRRSPLTGLLVAQFLGAFNDNAFKIVVALLAMAAVASRGEAAQQQ